MITELDDTEPNKKTVIHDPSITNFSIELSICGTDFKKDCIWDLLHWLIVPDRMEPAFVCISAFNEFHYTVGNLCANLLETYPIK